LDHFEKNNGEDRTIEIIDYSCSDKQFAAESEPENSPRRRGGHREKKIDNLCELRVSVVNLFAGFCYSTRIPAATAEMKGKSISLGMSLPIL
jgi:hypothetical protein